MPMRSMNTTAERPSTPWRRCRLTLGVAAALLPCAGHAGAADAAAGKARAQACVQCHGTLGLSTQPDAPNLAGQPALYLASQLRAFRSGARRHEVMTLIAKPLTDDDIDHLAAWFSSIRIEAHAPQ
jgi:cytochrome c553